MPLALGGTNLEEAGYWTNIHRRRNTSIAPLMVGCECWQRHKLHTKNVAEILTSYMLLGRYELPLAVAASVFG